MTLFSYRPQQMSLGPLEAEVLEIIWQLGQATVKAVHEKILKDPNRDLAYASVTTVLGRLTKKGWLSCDRHQRAYVWRAQVSREQAQALKAYDQLQQFLAISNPDIVATFADHLDTASMEQLEAIAARLKALRQQQEKGDA